MASNLLVSRDGVAARRLVVAMVLACVFSIAGCAAKRAVVVPAPDATLASLPNSAQGTDKGVIIVLQANAWHDFPQTLDRELIPLRVTIQNHSGRPLAVRYDDFVLVGMDNHRYSGIPPDQIKGNNYERLSPYWAYSDAYYVDVRLPTEAMLQQSISQGVVADSAETSGFLYFHMPTERQPTITFSAVLVDARTGQRFGSIDVPLRIEWF